GRVLFGFGGEQGVEAGVIGGQRGLEAAGPLLDGRQRRGVQAAQAAGALGPAQDQPGGRQPLPVPRGRGLAEGEVGGELHGPGLAPRQPVEDGEAGGIGQGGEGGGQGGGHGGPG